MENELYSCSCFASVLRLRAATLTLALTHLTTSGEFDFGFTFSLEPYLAVNYALLREKAVALSLIYPLQKFDGREARIHGFELLLRVIIIAGLCVWTSSVGMLDRFLEVWLIPAYIFSLLNSVRFIAEHYETPWNAGQLLGTRTIMSNRVNSFFWNNINYHIGHHVYPAVPWYNLQKLHAALLPEIARTHAVVDPGYFRVFFKAFRRGPESIERNALHVAQRRG